jgi:hypothetical protein
MNTPSENDRSSETCLLWLRWQDLCSDWIARVIDGETVELERLAQVHRELSGPLEDFLRMSRQFDAQLAVWRVDPR